MSEAPPSVTGLAPNSGTDDGGSSVNITGSDFVGATAVNFGSATAPTFTVNSPTSITAVSPPGTETIDVTVTTPSGTSSVSPADQYRYRPTPVVEAVSPTRGPTTGGTAVTVSGRNFTGATAVSFGSTGAASFTVKSPTSIIAVSPAEPAGRVYVSVTTPEGISADAPNARYSFTPTVTKVEPNTGSTSGGNTVIVSGSGFALGTRATKFEFGTTLATSVNCTSTTECTAVAPPRGAETVDVKATVNKIYSPRNRSGDQYTYN